LWWKLGPPGKSGVGIFPPLTPEWCLCTDYFEQKQNANEPL